MDGLGKSRERIGLIAACATLTACANLPEPPAQSGSATGGEALLAQAEADYAASAFDQAQAELGRIAPPTAASYRGQLLRGELALLKNRFREAEIALRASAKLDPSARAPKRLLAEVLVRQDRYAEASPWYFSAGQSDRGLQAQKVGEKPAFSIEASSAAVHIKADRIDPLMVVSARVNGGPPGHFLIDTGGSEVIVDTAFAQSNGVPLLGQESGTFSGGRASVVSLARVDTFALQGSEGSATLRNIPVQILDTQRFSAAFPGLRIDGVIGTQLLYHFRATLDYPRGELVLRGQKSPDGPHDATTPMWMGGDHYMVAMGSLNGVGPLPFFPDVGLAGLAFTAPNSTLVRAGVPVTSPAEMSGGGGGGSHSVQSIHIDRLSLGPVERRDLQGLAGPFPPTLERDQGFLISGIISHAFFRPYAVTFDFRKMQIDLDERPSASGKTRS